MAKIITTLTPNWLVALCVVLAGCAANGGFLTDRALGTRVKTAIATDVGPQAAAAVQVQTAGGVVQLSGLVYSADEAERVYAAAASVHGVKAVYSDLRLKPRPSP